MIQRGVMMRLDKLEPHPKNYNGHPAKQIAQLRKSLRTFGQVRDVVVWRSFIVAGHGVCKAAIAEGWEEIGAALLPEMWTEERVLAYLATDNEIARQSEPDDEQLARLLGAVQDDDLRELAAGGERRLIELMNKGRDLAALQGVLEREEPLQEKIEMIRPREMLRILVSVPVDHALDVRGIMGQLDAVPGIEIIYGAN